MVFLSLNDHNRALVDFNHAISLKPSYYKAYRDRAILYGIEENGEGLSLTATQP